MKRYLLLGFFLAFLLTGCTTPNRNPHIQSNYTEEAWMKKIDTSPNRWAQGADKWFMTGDPNITEKANLNPLSRGAISTMIVKVQNFNNIRTSGDFQLQIYGTDEAPNVSVLGPNAGVRSIAIEVRGNTLCLTQTEKATGAVKNVIVRVGVNRLFKLMQMGGGGKIEGVQLRSLGLEVFAGKMAHGNMYLTGTIQLLRVVNAGYGDISLFDVQARSLDISTYGGGDVNVSGPVTLHAIYHNGQNDINIIGAKGSFPVKIYAKGKGKVGINGQINIREVRAQDATCVYAYPLYSQQVKVFACNEARVGLAGVTKELFVETRDKAKFWGRFLCTYTAYARAYENSHINVTASDKLFAGAKNSASIYFFGPPELLSPFTSGNGMIIPVGGVGYKQCSIAYQKQAVKLPATRAYRWRNHRLTNYK